MNMYQTLLILLAFLCLAAVNGGAPHRKTTLLHSPDSAWRSLETGLFRLSIPADWQFSTDSNGIFLHKAGDTLRMASGWNLAWGFRKKIVDYAVKNRLIKAPADYDVYNPPPPPPPLKHRRKLPVSNINELPGLYFRHRVKRVTTEAMSSYVAYPDKMLPGASEALFVHPGDRHSLAISSSNLSPEGIKTFIRICESVRYAPDGKIHMLAFTQEDCDREALYAYEEIITPDDTITVIPPPRPPIDYIPKFYVSGDMLKIELKIVHDCAGKDIGGIEVTGNRINLVTTYPEDHTDIPFPGIIIARMSAECECLFCCTFFITGIKNPEEYEWLHNGYPMQKPLRIIQFNR